MQHLPCGVSPRDRTPDGRSAKSERPLPERAKGRSGFAPVGTEVSGGGSMIYTAR
jgi:hypothetical protein